MDPKEYGEMISKYTSFGVIATSLSLAKDVGILEVLYNTQEALTSQEIADKGNLKERYVRELMGALVTGGIVQVDESSTRFYISPEFKPVLQRNAIASRYVPYVGEKYSAIRGCFEKDGPAGVRYEEHPVVFSVMDEVREESQDRFLDDDVLPSTLGISQKLESGIDVAEVGCANATLLLNLSKRYPKSRFNGSDVVESVLEIARERAGERGLTNCEFEFLDVCHIPEQPAKQFDWIYSRGVIHDLPDPLKALSGVRRILKPGGIFTMVEYGLRESLSQNVGNIEVSYMYASSTFGCVPESYQGEGSTAHGPCWSVETIRNIVNQAGFQLIVECPTKGSSIEIIFVCKRPITT